MDSQLELILPIPIIEEIISFSARDTKLTFRVTCKRFLQFTTNHFFPTFTTTLCGNKKGYKNGKLINAKFYGPAFGVLNASCSILYMSDKNNHAIRRVDLLANRITTLCGDFTDNNPQPFYPKGLALDEKENLLYVSDSRNQIIRSVNLMNGKMNIIVKSHANDPLFRPCGLALDSISNSLYVADEGNHSIRKISLKEKKMEILSGNKMQGHTDGNFEEARFSKPKDVVLNYEMQELYVSDYRNHIIRVLSLENKTVSTLCGFPGVQGFRDGNQSQSRFSYPFGLALDIQSQYLYVTEDTDTVRKISLLDEVKVTTLCGTPRVCGNRNGFFPTFNTLHGIAFDSHSNSIYVMDYNNDQIRKISDRKRTLFNNEIPFLKKKRL